MTTRPWTRSALAGMAGHLAYELAAGVGVPLASRLGVLPASAGYLGVFAGTYAAAGRVPGRRGDVVAAVADGVMLAAVLNHYASWPRDPQRRVPWLIECEGLQGPLLVPYNVMLMLSAVLSTAGLAEARGAWPWGFGAASAAYPLLRWGTRREFEQRVDQAVHRPRWWNRRLIA